MRRHCNWRRNKPGTPDEGLVSLYSPSCRQGPFSEVALASQICYLVCKRSGGKRGDKEEQKPMPFADSEGIRIYYDDSGEGEPALACVYRVGVTLTRFSLPWPSA